MNRTIWTCWFQGRHSAPPLVQRCIASWEQQNPGWTVRCLDAEAARRLTELDQLIDTNKQSITAASLSDVLRIMLLHEFGGVWVDATTLCNRPLDEWLPAAMERERFFAFDRPAKTRPIASWFLAAQPNASIVQRWHRDTVDYWQHRESSEDYFWFHHLFREALAADDQFAAAWERVPKISADGPHSFQHDGRMYRPLAEVQDEVDWSAPLFKLTYRLRDCAPSSFIDQLLASPAHPPAEPEHGSGAPITYFTSLSVETDNVGDHIQIIAADRLLARLGCRPQCRVDRDKGLAVEPPSAGEGGSVGLILNGWFKRGAGGWPPHPAYSVVPIGLHLRPRKSPALLSEQSLQFFRTSGPVGGRDQFTTQLLANHGVPAFESNCLTTLFPQRVSRPTTQTEHFVVSRDERLLEVVPAELRPCNFINHYSGETDFCANMHRAEELLALYRDRAALLVTTLLHCALPAIAMGIPTIVFYPHNSDEGHQSDVERFSSLANLVPIHRLENAESVDWSPKPVDLGAHKLNLFDSLFHLARRWRFDTARPALRFAPSARTS